MTIRRVTDLTCGECGTTQEEEVWDTINAQINPELKEKLLEGKVNFFHCNKCGFEAFIPMQLLYHDMEKKFCVMLYPLEMVEDNQFFNRLATEAKLDLSSELPEGYTLDSFFPEGRTLDHFRNVHFVLSMGELARYVMFWDRLGKRKVSN